ncbi:hypothetical protein LZ31DRAFT_553966 [Colletotrichum somersetense]|nr:hypothetical protein LZ31DRAFT_553966 [Colletotrichum somersetense]
MATEFQVDHLQLPPGDRFASLTWTDSDPDVLLDEIGHGDGWDTASFGAVLGGPDDNNLVSFAEAYFFGVQALSRTFSRAPKRKAEPKVESWRKLARRVLPATSLEVLIHPNLESGISKIRLSPFFSGLFYLGFLFLLFDMEKREWRRRISRAVVMWLEDVQSSGTDLEEYGAAVRNLYLENAWLHTWKWEIPRGRGPRLVELTVGPVPEDWKLHWDWDFDDEEFAGEFWDTVENPPLRIPGGWVDE